ncbi:MAG: (Fe-S)-binding protein [Methylococcales bacterium]
MALFTGCISEHFDQKTLQASIKVLNALGFTVLVPKQQGCCGALHQHQGQSQIADQLATHNINVFNTLAIDAIIYTASACGLMLKEYDKKDSLAINKFNVPLLDITEFLCMHWPEGLKLNDAALSGKSVAVHEPCSQRNVSKVSEKKHQYVYSLLEKVTGLNVQPLPDNQLCCGSGGVHCLTHPEIAEPLRVIKLDHFKKSQADYLATTNIGCSLHLNSGLALNKVIHPVVLIAELIS